MGKASLSNILVPLAFVVISKALTMARLLVLASPLAILHPSRSPFLPLALYCYNPPPGWHPTAHHRLAPYNSSWAGIPTARWLHSPLYPRRSSHSSSLTPRRGIALPLWLPPTPWGDRCNYRQGRCLRFDVSPLFQWFCFIHSHYPLPQARVSKPQRNFVLFWGAGGRVWVSLPVRCYRLFPYVSGVLVS